MKLLKEINLLKKSPIQRLIDSRIKDFEAVGRSSNKTLFKELCFCILTANSTAEQCIKVHSKVDNGFICLDESALAKKLKHHGARFHTKRANYIVCSQKHLPNLKNIIVKTKDENELRDWFVKNIKGFGMKEASHFLRNIGFKNFAIIDFHIIDILEKNKLIKRPETLNRTTYLEIESVLKRLAKKGSLNLAELDLYLWYLETKKILK